jgi:hypothetical protein
MIPGRDILLLHQWVQTGYSAKKACCPMGTEGTFCGVKSTAHLCIIFPPINHSSLKPDMVICDIKKYV